jgi:hypothetical protein
MSSSSAGRGDHSAALHGDPRLRFWARAYAAATLVHLLLPDYDQPGWGPPRLVSAVGAALLLWRPLPVGFALCLVGAAWPLWALRDVLTQSALLLVWAAVGLWGAARRRGPAALDAVRWTTALTYALAALHKLNADFFDPAVSCAPHAWAQVAARWSLPDIGGLEPLLAPAAILTEVALTVAIARRSPWMWPLGVAFHLPLTVTLAPAFGAVMLAGYVAATTRRQAARWRRAVRRHPGLLVAAGGVAAVVDAALGGVDDPLVPVKVAAAGAILAGSLLALGPPGRCRRTAPAAWAVAALWTLNGLTPYLGVQYQHAAAMLSNLRVDAGCHNSLVFPEALRGADPYLRVDVARIGDGQRPAREAALREGLWSVPALHAMHANWCVPRLRPIVLEGTWRGRPFALPDLCADDWLDHLPGAGAVPAGLQRFQKNLRRDCPQACIH